jgi:hypothetical protein
MRTTRTSRASSDVRSARRPEGCRRRLLDDGPNGHPTTPRAPTEEGDDATIEAAKDVFHDHVGIRVLDDFTITFQIQADDVDLSTREDVTWL